MSFCFYISRVNEFATVSDVIRAFNKIGVVHRVDFTPVNKQPGFKEDLSGKHKSAFVHVTELLTLGKEIRFEIVTTGMYKFYPYLAGHSSEYWVLSKSRNSVQDTMMNNAQIVHNCRYLEEKLEAKIEEQAATIQALTEKLDGVHIVVQQLLGGLFCQKSQGQALTDHLSFLFPERYTGVRSRFEEPDDSKWTSWPTTRQGDECERRIEALEKSLLETRQAVTEKEDDIELQIQALEQKFSELTIEPVFTPYEEQNCAEHDDNEDQDTALYARKFAPIQLPYVTYQDHTSLNDDSISTHSSMPDLIDDDECELACFKTRGELQRLYYKSHPEEPNLEMDDL
jgi:hypothetical protein